jgi:hypothetical protein
MDLGEIGCEDGMWMKLAQDYVQTVFGYQNFGLNY